MNILVSGATGFIGRAFCRVAIERGHRLLALCRNGGSALPPVVEIATGSLVGTPWAQIEQFAPDAVLHLAWIATPGVYLTSPENEVWLQQSMAWFRQLHALGVQRIAGTGTCIEYAASAELLEETISPLDPIFPYSRSKAALFEWLRDGGAGPPSAWSWFRVFHPYGPGEHPDRICTSLMQRLRAGRSLALRTPHSVRDCIFIDDVALAMCQSIEAKMPGAINVGTGQGVSIKELAARIVGLLSADPALVQMAEEPDCDPSPFLVAGTGRLRSIGWTPRTNLDAGLRRLLHSLPPLTG